MSMAVLQQLLLLTLTSSVHGAAEPTDAPPGPQKPAASYPVGDVRNCLQLGAFQYQMEVLPNIGFDNLRNLDMGQVHALNYSTCQVSRDGKFLIPDDVYLIPVQESKVNLFAEYIDHWDQHTSMTAKSINTQVGGSYDGVSGKFSVGYTTTKTHMYNSNSLAKSTRTQVRVKRYTVKLNPDAQLHHIFVSRLLDIAASIQDNNTASADYLSELMVRDYGTHYVYSMDAGAVLAKSDFIKEVRENNITSHSNDYKVAASVSFMDFVSVKTSMEYKQDDTIKKAFLDNQVHSEVNTAGGGPFMGNMTLKDWEGQIDDSLVGIDRSGEPLHFAINPNTLPSLPETTVYTLAEYVENAIKRYYKQNTHPGCSNPRSPNFNLQANLNDKTCKDPLSNPTFGGIYQECEMVHHSAGDLCYQGKHLLQKNPLTSQLNCPGGYKSVKLHTGSVWVASGKKYSQARYTTYWCMARETAPQNSGFLFGGCYTSNLPNPITGRRSCPSYYITLKIGDDITVCVSNDYEEGMAYSIDFGGFESCSAGNPLAEHSKNAKTYPHGCPHGYISHLMAVENSCEISYCMRQNALKHTTLLDIRLPPYQKRPKQQFNSNTTTRVIEGLHGETWVKSNAGVWELISAQSPPTDESTRVLGKGSIAGITISVTVVLGVVIVGVVFAWRKVAKFKKARVNYTNIADAN